MRATFRGQGQHSVFQADIELSQLKLNETNFLQSVFPILVKYQAARMQASITGTLRPGTAPVPFTLNDSPVSVTLENDRFTIPLPRWGNYPLDTGNHQIHTMIPI